MMKKTTKMEKTDKFAVTSTEQGYKIGTYASPIMDEGFYQKFTDIHGGQVESKKDVTV
jgi:hypothetical protein